MKKKAACKGMDKKMPVKKTAKKKAKGKKG